MPLEFNAHKYSNIFPAVAFFLHIIKNDYDQRGRRRGSRGGGNQRGTRTIGSSDDRWVVKYARMTRRRREGK